MSIFSENLKNLLKNNNLSQYELAKILNNSQQSVSRYVNGVTEPDIETLTKISQYFNVSVDDLLFKKQSKSLGEILKELRQKKFASQSEIALALNIAISTYANWEQGRTEPNILNIKQIAKYFNVTTDYLLGVEISQANQNLLDYEIKLLEEQRKLNSDYKKELLNYANYLSKKNNSIQ